jgi:hypothetical protein
MMDVHTSEVAGTVRLIHSDLAASEVVLIPTPSDDIADPLNWAKGRKYIQLACLILYVAFQLSRCGNLHWHLPSYFRYTLAAALSASSLFAIFVPLSEATGLSLEQLNAGTGFSYFPIGFGPLLLQPLALALGKRPVYVGTAIAMAGVVLWTPKAEGYGQWVANRLLFGFVGSPSFAMVEVSISDVVSRGIGRQR